MSSFTSFHHLFVPVYLFYILQIGNFELNFPENVFSLAYIPLFIIIMKNSTSSTTDRLIKVHTEKCPLELLSQMSLMALIKGIRVKW